MLDITLDELRQISGKKLWQGEYEATDAFRSIQKHAAVCFDDGVLVAVTGRADDRESQLYAALFAAAPEMLVEIARLRKVLEEVLDIIENKMYTDGFEVALNQWAAQLREQIINQSGAVALQSR